MKIIIRRRNTTNFPLDDSFNDAKNEIKTALAHISHKIWIKDIQILNTNVVNSMWAMNQNEQTIFVKCTPQGDTLENQDLVELVADAISLRGNLVLDKIIIEPTIQVSALEKLKDNTYRVEPYFAGFIAKDESYRKEILNSNVENITFELVQIDPNFYRPTGKIATIFKNSEKEPDPKNIYYILAKSLSENAPLRKKLLDNEVDKILFKITKDNNVVFNVSTTSSFKIPLQKPEIQNKIDTVVTKVNDLNLNETSEHDCDQYKSISLTCH